ncbi:MAG: sulfatase family protein [Saccharofermentanales bacterium]
MNKQITKKPNLVFIMTDQQPMKGVGCYGGTICQTPNIDRIARDGIRFSQQHIASFPCCASRASIMTGLYAHNHGVIVNEVPLDEKIPTLGTILSDAGYSTAYIGKSHLGGSMYRDLEEKKEKTGNLYGDNPFNANFKLERIMDDDDEYNNNKPDTYYVKTFDGYKFKAVPGGTGEDIAAMGFEHWVGGWNHYRKYLVDQGYGDIVSECPYLGNHTTHTPFGIWEDGKHNYSLLPEEHHQDSFLANSAAEYLNTKNGTDKPFGMVVSFFGPHHPVAPPSPWHDMYKIEDIEIPANYHDPRKRDNYIADKWTDEQIKDYTRRYWGYCSFIDHQVGKVLDALDKNNLSDNTIVVFLSDHGDMIGGHGQVFKGESSGFDELMRAPLIIRYPGHIDAGIESDSLVSNIDVLPTVLDLMDIKTPVEMDGKEFTGIFNDAQTIHRDTTFTYIQRGNFSAVDKNWRYCLNRIRGGKDELYDRVNDKDELNNLADDPSYKEIVADMENRIIGWLSSTGYPYMKNIK